MKIISLHSIKGGTGKSFLCQLFASYLSRRLNVAIVDLDASGPVLQFMGAAPETPAIAKDAEYNEDIVRPFPYFYERQIQLLNKWSTLIPRRGKPNSPSNYQEFRQRFEAKLDAAEDKTQLLPLDVRLRGFDDPVEEWKDPVEEWKEEIKRCVLSGWPFGRPCAGKVLFVVLPHRPEFLRRLNQLTQSPEFDHWRIVTRWLLILLQGLEDGSLTPNGAGTDVVLIDNSPGSSATAHITSLLRRRSKANGMRNHAVCFVTTPRIADIVNSAYELTWLQASGTELEDSQPVYWIGNMWSPDTSMENILMTGLRWVFNYISGGKYNPALANAMRFAGLNAEDEQRISAVLKIAYLAGKIVPSTLNFTPDLRPLFDFSAGATQVIQALDDIFPLFENDWRLFRQLGLTSKS